MYCITEVAALQNIVLWTSQRKIMQWSLMSIISCDSNPFGCVSYTPPMISFLYGALKMRNQSVVSITIHLWQLGRVLVVTSNARSGKLGMYVALCHVATFTLWGTEQMRYRPCCVWRTPTTKELFLFTPWTAYHVWEIIDKDRVVIFYVNINGVK